MSAGRTYSSVHKDLGCWLDRVVQWQQQNPTVKSLLGQAESCTELASFLQYIKTLMTEIGSIDGILQELPQVGQLLGRLSTIHIIMCHPKTYEALMSCILFFYVSNPCTPVEIRAQQWVVSQVRHMVCSSETSEENLLLGSTGLSQRHIYVDYLKKIIDGVFQENFLRNNSSDGHPHIKDQPDRCSITEACALCLHLSDVSDINYVLEQLICSIHLHNPPEAEQVYELITESQKSAYTGDECTTLTYEALCATWSNYLPSLEQEVLLLVHACCHLPASSIHDITEIAQSRYLVQACAESLPVYETVFSILKYLYWDTGGSTCIGRLIGSLHRAIRKYCITKNTEKTIYPRRLAPTSFRTLASLLEAIPSTLSQSAFEHRLQEIEEYLSSLRERSSARGDGDTDDQALLHFIFLQHQEWTHASLLAALTASKQVSSMCCQILLTFNSKDPSPMDKEYLLEIVLALRALMMKSCVQWDDIQCVLSSIPLNHEKFTKNLQTVLGQLLLVFTTHSVGAFQWVGQILEKFHQCTSARNKLLHLVDILELVSDFWTGQLRLQPLRVNSLIQLLDTLLIDALQDIQKPSQSTASQSTDMAENGPFLTKAVNRLKTQLNLILS